MAVLAALSLVVAACGSDDDDSADTTMAPTTTEAPVTTMMSTTAACVPDGTLKLGYILPSTGSLAQINEAMVSAVDLAVQEIGDADIQSIEMVSGDS